MRSIKIQESNLRFDPPANWPEDALGPCDALEVRCTPKPGTRMPPGSQPTLQSAWLPTPDELALLNAGHAVLLTVFGSLHPPVAIGVTPEAYAGAVDEYDTALEAAADAGDEGIPGSDDLAELESVGGPLGMGDLEEGVSNGEGEQP